MPQELARDMALLTPLAAGLDVALLAHDTRVPAGKVAPVYLALGQTLGLDRLRAMAGKFSPPEHWDRLALRRLMDDISQSQRGIAAKLLGAGGYRRRRLVAPRRRTARWSAPAPFSIPWNPAARFPSPN